MILVQNLRLRLNGNSLFAVLSAFILVSCNAFKVISKDTNDKPNDSEVVVEPNTEKNSDPIKEEGKELEVVEEVTRELVYLQGHEFKVEPHKMEFKVALILPFYFNAQTNRERRMSDYMLEYYQGVKLALTELEHRGFKLKLHVYDNENSTVVLNKILKKSDLSKMDLIIGPIGQEHMEIVSDFGLENNIPIISPISSIDSLNKINPKFYSTTPGTKAKATKVAQHLQSNYKKNPIILVTDEQTYSMSDKNEYVAVLEKAGFKNIRTESASFSSWSAALADVKNTTIIILSHNPTVVSTTLSKVYQTKSDVVIFGDNSWSNFQDNDYKFWSKLNVHLIASDFVDDSTSEVRNFRINYRLINKADPGVYAYLGYDQILFMGEFLMAFGEFFPTYINQKKFRYLSSTYHYEYQKGFNQNTNVFLLKFENYELRPIE